MEKVSAQEIGRFLQLVSERTIKVRANLSGEIQQRLGGLLGRAASGENVTEEFQAIVRETKSAQSTYKLSRKQKAASLVGKSVQAPGGKIGIGLSVTKDYRIMIKFPEGKSLGYNPLVVDLLSEEHEESDVEQTN